MSVQTDCEMLSVEVMEMYAEKNKLSGINQRHIKPYRKRKMVCGQNQQSI